MSGMDQIWGQTRCPICGLGTFNVKRSTLNFQWGDRKGAWWAGYGDRHGVWGMAEQIEGQTQYLVF
jgi:hypothetical protein